MTRRTSLVLAVALLAGCQGHQDPGAPSESAPSESAPSESVPSESAPSDPAARNAGWAGDLQRLVEAREQLHPEPWHGISREEYVAAVDQVTSRVEELGDDELLVELTRLAAMPTWAGRDGHGGIYPWGEGSYGTHLYPLRLYWFADGLFVVDALPPHEDLVGRRLDAIAGHPVEEVLDAVEPLVPRDNHMQVLSHSPRLVVVAELLHGLGFLDDPGEPAELTFAPDSATVPVEPVPVAEFERAFGGHHTHSPPPDPDGPLWLRDVDGSVWWELVDSSRTAYIAYNVTLRPRTVVEQVRQELEAGTIDRLLVDVRHNPGGDNNTYGSLLSLVEDAAARLPGGAYVAIGRATFSAAGNFVTEVERETDAVLVGEDSGTSPNQYGDSVPTRLDHSGLVLRVARSDVVRSDPDDTRVTVEPDLEVPLSSVDYFSGVDPVWEAVLDEG